MRTEIFKFLSSISLFSGLSHSALRSIYKYVKEISVQSYDFIYQSGDVSKYIYIVRYGEVIIRLGAAGERFRYIGQGEVFSEHSILTKSPHYGTAQAVLDTVLYAIEGNAFLALADRNKSLAQNIVHLLSHRMKDVLSSSKEKSEARRLICHIPLEELHHFEENLKDILNTESIANKGAMKLLSIDFFKNKTPQETVSEIAALRKHFPILHMYFDSHEKACDLNTVVMQADQIVLWERDPHKKTKEKKEIFDYMKKCVRNFDERSIRMVENGRALHRQSYAGKNKVFIRKETLARYLISKTRGLALGGGGARSLAHIGILKVLEEESIKIDYVSGCSFGAIIAALYARGESYASTMKIMNRHFGRLRKPIFDARLPLISFYKGKNMEEMVRSEFGDQKIEDLNIPFVTSAVDLLTGDEYVFDKGPIWEAIVATMSLPGVFPPRFVGKHLLADGGILNNIPDNLIRSKGASQIISVNVAPLNDIGIVDLLQPKNIRAKMSLRAWWEELTHPPILKIINRAITLEGRELIKMRTKNMDFFVNFKLNEYSIFDFNKYETIVAEGEKQFREYLPGVKKLFFPGLLTKT